MSRYELDPEEAQVKRNKMLADLSDIADQLYAIQDECQDLEITNEHKYPAEEILNHLISSLEQLRVDIWEFGRHRFDETEYSMHPFFAED